MAHYYQPKIFHGVWNKRPYCCDTKKGHQSSPQENLNYYLSRKAKVEGGSIIKAAEQRQQTVQHTANRLRPGLLHLRRLVHLNMCSMCSQWALHCRHLRCRHATGHLQWSKCLPNSPTGHSQPDTQQQQNLCRKAQNRDWRQTAEHSFRDMGASEDFLPIKVGCGGLLLCSAGEVRAVNWGCSQRDLSHPGTALRTQHFPWVLPW